MDRLLSRKTSLTRISSGRRSLFSDQIQISSDIRIRKIKREYFRLIPAKDPNGSFGRSSLLFHIGTLIRNKTSPFFNKRNTIFGKCGKIGDSPGYTDIKALPQPAGPGKILRPSVNGSNSCKGQF